MRIAISIVVTVLALALGVQAQDSIAQATAELELAQTNQSYIASEIEQSQKALKEAQDKLAHQQQLLTKGLIPRQTVEQAERLVDDRQRLLDLLIEQKRIADRSVALAEESLELAHQQVALQRRSTTIKRVTKHYGRGTWSSQDLQKLGDAFREQFGRPLPITALGQTRTHDRLGYNHHRRMDIGVHPDHPEGQWIMNYLEEHGIPFIAFRNSVAGHATGPHIHVGLPSPRL